MYPMETTNPTPTNNPTEDPSQNIHELRDSMSATNRSIDNKLQAAHEAKLAELRKKVAEATTEPHQIDTPQVSQDQHIGPATTPQ